MSDRWERIAESVRAELSPDEQHPQVDDLVAYHRRHLSPDREEEVQEHLAGCPQCSSLVLEFAEFWDSSREPWHRRVGPLRFLAAAALTATVGLGFWITQAGAPKVRVGALVVSDLRIESEPTRSETQTVEIADEIGEVHFYLTGFPDRRVLEYGAEIRTGAGGRVLEVRSIPLVDDSVLSLLVPRGLLPPGVYQIDVRGLDAESADAEVLATYRFRIVSEEEPR